MTTPGEVTYGAWYRREAAVRASDQRRSLLYRFSLAEGEAAASEVGESLASLECLLVHPVASFHLAILLWTPRLM